MSTANLKAVATGQAVETKNPVAVFRGLLEKQKSQIAAALPRHLSPDRMIRLACTEFAKNPMLQECSQVSVFGSIVQASQLGLEIGVLGQAYLVPFKKNKKEKDGSWSNTWECQLIPGYKGLIALARRSGEVTSIETNIVYTADKFNLTLGIDSKIEHEPFLDGERGKPRLVYGVAKFKDGGHHLEWMTIGDVEKIKATVFERNRLTPASKSPWNTDYEQMVRKTLIRRMANYLPMSVELEAALQVDDAATAGKGATIDGDFIVTERDRDDAGDPGPMAGQAERVDTATGEIGTGPAKTAEDASGEAGPRYAEILDGINKAATLEDLDVTRSHIKDVTDEAHKAELNAAASARLKEIKAGR